MPAEPSSSSSALINRDLVFSNSSKNKGEKLQSTPFTGVFLTMWKLAHVTALTCARGAARKNSLNEIWIFEYWLSTKM